MGTRPGKFEGEPDYVEDYWGLMLEGQADDTRYVWASGEPIEDDCEDDALEYAQEISVFHLCDADAERQPELAEYEGMSLEIWEDRHGFVYHQITTREES